MITVLFFSFPLSFGQRRGEKKWDETPAKSLYKIPASEKYSFCQHPWWPVPGLSVNGAGRLEIFRLRLCFRAPTRVCALMEHVDIEGTVRCSKWRLHCIRRGVATLQLLWKTLAWWRDVFYYEGLQWWVTAPTTIWFISGCEAVQAPAYRGHGAFICKTGDGASHNLAEEWPK